LWPALANAANGCFQKRLRRLKVRDGQDELWGYVRMKEKAKGLIYKNVDTLGDAYCFVAIERNTKMILSWHLGRRTAKDTLAFIFKLRNATAGRFQLSADGWTAYPEAIEKVFGAYRWACQKTGDRSLL
jgi:hypothetical protein